MARKPKILFVCSDGLLRCQMAEGFAGYYGGASVQLESAGPSEEAPNPFGLWAMNEAGIDITFITGERLEGLELGSFSHIVTLCGTARDNLGQIPAGTDCRHWDIPDPASVRGNPDDQIKAFRAVRNQIEKRVQSLLADVLGK